MSDTKLNSDFWNERYSSGNTGWDIGYASPPLIEYVKKRVEPHEHILIPGVGNGYELEALWKLGYRNIHGADVSELAKENFMGRVPDFPEHQYLLGDFFALDKTFDVILEQTFFCAIEPRLRADYVSKVRELLNDGGRLAGVLFNFEKPEGPPFGGSEHEYRALFDDQLVIGIMEECRNSIPPRQGSEFFIELFKNN